MDWAHDWTDQQIVELTVRMQAAYDEAAKEMAEKLSKFLSEYDSRNQDMRAKVASGEMDQDAYDDWLKFQANRQKWLQGMSEELAVDATRVDQLAMDLINERVPEVFSENVNHSFYGIETEIGWDTHSFTLYDQKTVALMLADPDATRLPEAKLDETKDAVWNMRKINEAITQSILQGESIPNAAKRLRAVVTMDNRAAVRTARTIMTSAENAGRVESYRVADKVGVKVQKQWIATIDLRTRPSHRLMNKVHVPYDQPFVVGPNKAKMMHPADPKGPAEECYNCFLGETMVATDSRIVRSYKHLYVGETITVKTSRGVEFTCTPNHPILTTRGWVAAKLLDQGDCLCVTSLCGGVGRGNPDIDHVMASMEAVHELLSVLADKRTCLLSVDFHGDVPTSDVEIVGEERLLREDWDACFGEDIAKLPLEDSDSPSSRLGSLPKGLRGVMTASAGILGGKCVLLSFLEGHAAHPDAHGLGAVATLDSSIPKNTSDNVSGVSDSLGDGLLGLASKVGIDHITDVEVGYTRGSHVYNLQTANGRYFVGSKDNDIAIIAHNCRCTLVGWVEGIEDEDPEQWSRLPEGMTYEQWMKAKENDQSKQQVDDGIPDDGNPKTLAGVRRGKSMTFKKANELRGNPRRGMDAKARDAYLSKNAEKNKALQQYLDSNSDEDYAEYQRLLKEVEEAKKAMQQAQKDVYQYTVNCQTCVVANEARRRGYDVMAKGCITEAQDRLAADSTLAWIDPSTGQHPELVDYGGSGKTDVRGRVIATPTSYWKWLNQDGVVESDARYTFEFEWRGRARYGHIINLERTDGGLRLYDPQVGETYVGDEVRKYLDGIKFSLTRYGTRYSTAPKILRIDNLDFDTDMVDGILEEFS